MKKFMYLAVAALALNLAACGNSSKKAGATINTITVSSAQTQYVEEILASADSNVGKEVTLKGFITHTCKHSGRRCFVVGKDQQTSIRVEAKGEIGGFNRELIGSEVIIKGILRENKLSKEYIDQMEEAVNEKKAGGESTESCESEMQNITAMRRWMKEHNKDSYSVYYIDGINYEVVEE